MDMERTKSARLLVGDIAIGNDIFSCRTLSSLENDDERFRR